jgi:hypothetical protein
MNIMTAEVILLSGFFVPSLGLLVPLTVGAGAETNWCGALVISVETWSMDRGYTEWLTVGQNNSGLLYRCTKNAL